MSVLTLYPNSSTIPPSLSLSLSLSLSPYSRIQFYASIFQSLASNEALFHSEVTKVDEDLAGIMDSLAIEAATAIHTTKKERTLDST